MAVEADSLKRRLVEQALVGCLFGGGLSIWWWVVYFGGGVSIWWWGDHSDSRFETR